MIGIEAAISSKITPKNGVIYTRAWMLDFVLDLAGYLPEKRLADLVALEPSAGDGAFLSGMVRRLVESCEHLLRAARSHDGTDSKIRNAQLAMWRAIG